MSYEMTVAALATVEPGSRVRLTAANGYSVTGVYTLRQIPGRDEQDAQINGSGGASILHFATRVEVMGENGRYREVTARECIGRCGADLDPDMGPYCPECQQTGKDPEVTA